MIFKVFTNPSFLIKKFVHFTIINKITSVRQINVIYVIIHILYLLQFSLSFYFEMSGNPVQNMSDRSFS